MRIAEYITGTYAKNMQDVFRVITAIIILQQLLGLGKTCNLRVWDKGACPQGALPLYLCLTHTSTLFSWSVRLYYAAIVTTLL